MVSLWFCVTSAPTPSDRRPPPAHNQCPFQRTFPLCLSPSLSLRHWSSFWCSSIDFSVQCTYNFAPLSFPCSFFSPSLPLSLLLVSSAAVLSWLRAYYQKATAICLLNTLLCHRRRLRFLSLSFFHMNTPSG